MSHCQLHTVSDSPLDDANVLRFLTGAGKQEALVETGSVILLVPV